ncbi:Fic/DOC family protein [Parasphaerochaeta coccoides]|uniref:protein adenylyltransferase n=1 Tax=Parasphaerochaeta coccoides (strain ATCC BAA-1237 / DSM 17374 / SPN1) TaxID=760011 RepID=F4GHH8_PARC1|nr:Fic family protein [Parasphaerochaeta coccoides]AEC02567.1 filamentation induced by cAMP protein Fic [Parasphaerochaeta coccoides DSM 17374]
MKSRRIEACIGFVKFSLDVEGLSLTQEGEEQLRSILDEDVSANEAVEAIIEQEGLSTVEYLPPAQENADYPGTSVPVNFFNIKDRSRARSLAARMANIRTVEILAQALPHAYDFELLKSLHASLYGDMYPSAGMIRTSAASKRTVFCQPQFIESMADEIFGKLRHDVYLKKLDRDDFINDYAYYMGEIEALHPFKTGNGRAARLFFYLLAMNAGWNIDWQSIEPDRMLEADISAIDGDYQPFISVLSPAVFPL